MTSNPISTPDSSQVLTLSDAADALRAGTLTSVELVQRCLAVAEACDDTVGMFLARYTESALAAAEAADAALAAGEVVGPLHGIPLGIKDIITTTEGVTTGQSLVHDRAAMSGDAVVTQRLRDAGGIVLGKLSTMEFACGAPDASKPFPVPRNPWSLDHWAGGSSSGSGSAVSTGAVLGALGTDTGGSIRIPAAFCGISGLMPTFGRVPKSGCIPLGFSLDHIGPMARSAKDCALMLQVLAGYDESDLCALDVPVGDYVGALSGDLAGVTIGADRLGRIAGEFEDPAVADAFEAALAALEQRGATVVELELPLYAEMSTADMVILVSEAYAYHRPDLQERWLDFGGPTRQILGLAALYSASDFVQAQRARTVGTQALARLYKDVDLILTPTSAAGAVSFDDLAEGLLGMRRKPSYTGYWDTTGNPVLSVPMGFTDAGLPLGLQICGRPFEEGLVLRAGDAFQQATDWHLRVPPLATSMEGVAA